MFSYGLKQTPRAWSERFLSVVIAASFSTSAHDVHFLSTFQLVGKLFYYMPIITDDDSKCIAFVKARHSEFLMSDLGHLRYFLEIEVSSTFNGFFISQEKSNIFLLALMSTLLRLL